MRRRRSTSQGYLGYDGPLSGSWSSSALSAFASPDSHRDPCIATLLLCATDENQGPGVHVGAVAVTLCSPAVVAVGRCLRSSSRATGRRGPSGRLAFSVGAGD